MIGPMPQPGHEIQQHDGGNDLRPVWKPRKLKESDSAVSNGEGPGAHTGAAKQGNQQSVDESHRKVDPPVAQEVSESQAIGKERLEYQDEQQRGQNSCGLVELEAILDQMFQALSASAVPHSDHLKIGSLTPNPV